MKSSFLAVIFFGAGVAACSGTTDKTGAGGDGGQDEVTTSTNSASGTGGAGGSGTGGAAGMGGMGGMGGGGPALKADKLGQTCNVAKVCPMGYLCVYPPSTPTAGFCTLPCSGPMDSNTCSALNGFPGPGGGLCNAQIMGQTGFYCGIVCGTQFGIPEDCPTGLTCKDLIDPAKMGPGMDGKTDSCTP